MKRWLATVPFAALAAGSLSALATPAPARAQSGVSGLAALVSLSPGSTTTIGVHLSGALTVAFHGDAGAGCAARGLCDYAGTVSLRPAPNGEISVQSFREHHRRKRFFALTLQAGGPGSGSATYAQVMRRTPGEPPAICADRRQDASDPIIVAGEGSSLPLSIPSAGSSLLQTRCAGPLDGDLAGVLPARTLALRAALHGRMTIDLRGTRSFAANGLAGTARSSIVLRLGKPHTLDLSRLLSPPKSGQNAVRVVVEKLAVGLSGDVLGRYRGVAEPDACTPLDACGLAGTFTLRPRPRAFIAVLAAVGPARRPYRDFLAALAGDRRGRAGGIGVGGLIQWTEGGSVLTRSRQATTCSDSGAMGDGAVQLAGRAGRLRADYKLSVSSLLRRSRCPGPLVGSARSASGSIPLRDLAHRTISIPLRGSSAFSDDGYAGRASAHLTLTLRRGTITQRVIDATGFL